MALDFDADLAAMFGGDFADTLTVTAGGATASGILDEQSERFLSEDGLDVRKRAVTFTLPAPSLPAGLAVDAAVTVRGVAYRVRDIAPPEQGDDGRTRVVVLAKV